MIQSDVSVLKCLRMMKFLAGMELKKENAKPNQSKSTYPPILFVI